MKLVPDWKNVWRWYSTHCLLLAASIPVAMAETESFLDHKFPLWAKFTLGVVIFTCGMVGRVIDQASNGETK